MDIQNEIKLIKDRNSRVEFDKAWEVSLFRRSIIILFTYLVAIVWLFIIENNDPWLNAFVPAGGYAISTFSLSLIKKKWLKNKSQH